MQKRDFIKTTVLFVLIVLTTVGSSLLLNLVTGPKIAADKAYRDELAAQQAAGVLLEVFPGATGFEDITTTLTIDPASGVSAVHKETSGKGYVIIASKTTAPMVDVVTVTVGIDMDGKITGLKEQLASSKDFPVSSNTINSFIGQDSTLSGVQITSGATFTSNMIAEAVRAGFQILAANDLMAAAQKSTEQVFEEQLTILYPQFTKDKKGNLTVPEGIIYQAYKSSNASCVVAYVEKDGQKLLTLTNVSGNVSVYKTVLINEKTQEYTVEDVTADNGVVVEEVKAFATTQINSTNAALKTTLNNLYPDATNVQELIIENQCCVVGALSYELDGKTYYMYNAKPINQYGPTEPMDIIIILDDQGKIVDLTIAKLYINGNYWKPAQGRPEISQDEYQSSLEGLDVESYDGSQSLITGATHTPVAVHEAIESVFAEFASIGGNN